ILTVAAALLTTASTRGWHSAIGGIADVPDDLPHAGRLADPWATLGLALHRDAGTPHRARARGGRPAGSRSPRRAALPPDARPVRHDGGVAPRQPSGARSAELV